MNYLVIQIDFIIDVNVELKSSNNLYNSIDKLTTPGRDLGHKDINLSSDRLVTVRLI